DNANPYLRDQMEVRISQDGGATFKTLQTIYRYDAKCTTPTWREYKMDLSKYSTGSCIIIAFTAYSYGGGDQTVDRVKIVAQQDMRVMVEVPSDTDFAACNLTGRSLKVYLENLTSQEVPFNAGDSITVEMSGASNFVYKQALTGRLENRELDSLILSPIDYVGGGQFDVIVYVNAIDSNAANDTAKFSLNLNPDLAVTGYDEIGFTEPGDTVYVGFTMKNTGNLEIVSPFNVSVVVNGMDTVTELVTAALKPGDTLYYQFKQGVIVPMTTADQPFYLLDVYALLPCDANGDNDSVRIIGNVNVIDNGILSIISPAPTPCAMGGTVAKVEVRLFNNGTVDNTDSLVVTAVIDSAGVVYATLTEKVAPMYAGENRNYSFSQSYRVPRLSANGTPAPYKVTAYLGALEGDIDLSNDTAKVEACVEGGVGVNEAEANRWTVGQNVPNPASELTRIPYMIPEAGALTLRIMGMNGQVLYREDINAEAGSGSIRVNLSDLAAGVYYYSVEYRGERVVRKMNVVR
ncbi:MAG: T9SS type A sorting domain-containing protein, partial [Bacteroidales bacterium]|nr:T9SS type A sorting domain-containing protein [Bacteroidales bacterium]